MDMRILLVDDHQLILSCLGLLIERQTDMELVGQAQNGHKAIQLVRELSPNIVIMDIVMPEMNGIEATRQIVEKFPDVKVIALTIYQDQRYVIEMLKAGASGYILKSCTSEEFLRGIRAVAANQTYLCADITSIVVKDYVAHLLTDEYSLSSILSDREREVLQLVAEGWTSKEIAARLHLSSRTIEKHRRSVMDKLNSRSVAELTKYAVRAGLTSLER